MKNILIISCCFIFSSPLVGEGLGGGAKNVVVTPHPAPSPTRGEGTQRFWQRLAWTTDDGVRLVGLYHPAHHPGAYTWILLHGLGSNKEEWDAFARQAAGQGNGVFIYDARGHNESRHLKTGGTVSYTDWKTAGPGSPWSLMPSDLASAVQMLQEKFGLSDKKIAVGGASLGANVALAYASAHAPVPALILLSPGIEYAGIQTPAAFYAYRGRPVFLAASPNDAYAYASARRLADLAPGPTCRMAEGKNGHGVNMLDAVFTKTLLDWMKGLDGNRDRRSS
jgi:pimeloyl-ACP methyl ester carboxylesterase